MDAPDLVVPKDAATAAADVLREMRKSNGFRDTVPFVGGFRNLFRIPKSVRSLVAYAKKWQRPQPRVEKQHAIVPRTP